MGQHSGLVVGYRVVESGTKEAVASSGTSGTSVKSSGSSVVHQVLQVLPEQVVQ